MSWRSDSVSEIEVTVCAHGDAAGGWRGRATLPSSPWATPFTAECESPRTAFNQVSPPGGGAAHPASRRPERGPTQDPD